MPEVCNDEFNRGDDCASSGSNPDDNPVQKEPPPGPSVAHVTGTSLSATEKGLVVCGATLGAVLIVALLNMLYRVVKRVLKGKPLIASMRSRSQHDEFPTFVDSQAYELQLSARSTYGPEPFTIGDLRLATDNFSEERVLGEGAFGKVFKGLHKKKPIAVKQMRIHSGGDADREFRSELEVISRVHHRNLVKLLGFVVEEDQRYLVMEFIPNGTLYAALHPKLSDDPLDWACRRTVAIGIARGMAYLHDDCYPRIIHRDLKSSNILLDNRYEAQVADFGLAKQDEFSATQTHLSTRVMGTFGYMDPAYANTGRLTEESDVYSFGVVLLELISGRKAVDITKPPGKQSLVEWARPLIEKKMTFQLADSLLDSEYDEGELRTMIQVASNCTNALPNRRPGMKEVLAILQGASMEQQAPAGQLTPVSEEISSVMSGPLNASDLGARLARLQSEEDPYNQTVIDPERFSTGGLDRDDEAAPLEMQGVFIAFHSLHSGHPVVINDERLLVQASLKLRHAAVDYVLEHYRKPLGGIKGNLTGRDLVLLEWTVALCEPGFLSCDCC
ncbi:proline-rich extensin-like receptor kinase (PERK) family [Klebsormidium nitens]|uniref:Proline-rich extensin-like receptor kinase (PERK) family n=1 Tax=Klebsormidium nitens TaxID=105231 RepID=A0A1Y1IPK1_KLENI|nr:proline-rich extensin-like receptor kinase (PERK) family [Klebsormidium nitens]|eukprot:GAQ92012.1 proline-rich extensin-like receptor kinase (PERK) family [Klebsormidium nitens]